MIKNFWQIAKEAGVGFSKHKILKLSASLCFYTMFSIGPILLLYISGLFWGQKAAEGNVYNQISGFIGEQPAKQIQELIKNATITNNDLMAVVSIVILIFTATTAFNEMHDSINTIWNLRIKKGRGFRQMLKIRLVSFLLISGIGLLFLAFLFISGLFEGFMHKIKDIFRIFLLPFFTYSIFWRCY